MFSTKKHIINRSIVDDYIINSDGNFTMKDSGFLSSFDNVTDLAIYVDSIEDVSGICEMDSLKSLTVSEGSISDEAINQLDEKGIKVTQKKVTIDICCSGRFSISNEMCRRIEYLAALYLIKGDI